jgi:hypothetical protein
MDQMPCRGFGGLLTNTADRAHSVPIQLKKRRRLQFLFDIFGPQTTHGKSANHLEEGIRELQCAMKEQIKVLSAILEVLREKNGTN